MNSKQDYDYFYAPYRDKIPYIHGSDIFQLKIRIPDNNKNIFAILGDHDHGYEYFTEYIHDHDQTAYWTWVSNILVPSNPTEYEYQIHLFLGTWQNKNIEYICS